MPGMTRFALSCAARDDASAIASFAPREMPCLCGGFQEALVSHKFIINLKHFRMLREKVKHVLGCEGRIRWIKCLVNLRDKNKILRLVHRPAEMLKAFSFPFKVPQGVHLRPFVHEKRHMLSLGRKRCVSPRLLQREKRKTSTSRPSGNVGINVLLV
jgi:hypothetical protein